MPRRDIGGGLIVMAVGLMLLAANFDVMPVTDVGRSWPLILVVIGASQVLFPDEDGRLGGLPLLVVGGVFLAHNYDVMRIHQSWPLFVVAAGIGILASSWACSSKKAGQ